MQIPEAGADFNYVDLEKPSPSKNEVLIKVEACGICHSDAFVKEGTMPGIEYPKVPGHEVVGTVESVGANITHWSKGQRVGVAGMADTVLNVNPAEKETLSTARTARLPVSVLTAGMPST